MLACTDVRNTCLRACTRNKIDLMEDEITAILKEEKIEKDLRLAEMEANKAQNVMLHQVCVPVSFIILVCMHISTC